MTTNSRSRRTFQPIAVAAIVVALTGFTAPCADARDQLCDTSVVDCRTPLLDLIKAEKSEIDVGMWFMEDARYATELIRRMQLGVKVRIIMDDRSNEVGHPGNATVLTQLATNGVPMRKRIAKGIEHWKVMVFDSQNTV